VEPIPDQVIGVGQTVKVFVIARDPEGANLFLGFVESPAETIATAQSDGQGNVDVTGVSPGEVTISLSVADNVENETPVFFTVRVEGAPEGQPNEAPNIQPVSNKTIALDTFLPVPLVASDPEGGEVTLNASSADEAVATVQIQDGNAMVYGAGEGQTAITITAIDGQGNTASLIFSVTVTVEVAEPPPAGDTPPELPIIADNLQQNAQAIFASANNSADRFIVVGDATPADLLGDAGDGFADLSPAPDLQATLDTYLNQPADDGNILNQGGARASNADWLLADLLNPANNAPDCADAPHPLACSVAIQTPSVAVMIVGRNDIAQGTPLDAFEADLNRAVDELVARGVIPVLATIPGDAAVTDPYNQIIIRVADENVIPLWNLNAAIPAEQVNADLTLSAPEATQNVNLTLADSFGAVKRNLQLLQILQSLRENVLVN
jgi:hypothetical protein